MQPFPIDSCHCRGTLMAKPMKLPACALVGQAAHSKAHWFSLLQQQSTWHVRAFSSYQRLKLHCVHGK